jgi:hypothetical protein
MITQPATSAVACTFDVFANPVPELRSAVGPRRAPAHNLAHSQTSVRAMA